MCGIAGEWDFDGTPSVANVTAMIDAIAHRGPEGRTCWVSPNGKLAFAHAQLSFFKGAETQPVSNTDGTIFAVCNARSTTTRISRGSCATPESIATFGRMSRYPLSLPSARRSRLCIITRLVCARTFRRRKADAFPRAGSIWDQADLLSRGGRCGFVRLRDQRIVGQPGGAAPPRLPRDCHDLVRPHRSRNERLFVHSRGQARVLRGNSWRQRNGETVLVARIRASRRFGRSGRIGAKFSRRF